jgi:NAD(P)H-dependent FMN reductase
MTRILGISGSLRKGSFNTSLLRAAQSLAGDGIAFEVATLDGIPLYNGDLEDKDGIPAAVHALKEKIVASDGVILAVPEYNGGIAGVMKNALDWLSRPYQDAARIYKDRPFALAGATPSGFGTVLAQDSTQTVLRHLGARQWNGARLMISKAHEAFGADGTVKDEAVAINIGSFVREFAAFAAKK